MTKSISLWVLSGVALLFSVSPLWSTEKPYSKMDKPESVEVQKFDPSRPTRQVWVTQPGYTQILSSEVIAMLLGAIGLFLGIIGIVEAKEAQKLAKEAKGIVEEARHSANPRGNNSQQQ